MDIDAILRRHAVANACACGGSCAKCQARNAKDEKGHGSDARKSSRMADTASAKVGEGRHRELSEMAAKAGKDAEHPSEHRYASDLHRDAANAHLEAAARSSGAEKMRHLSASAKHGAASLNHFRIALEKEDKPAARNAASDDIDPAKACQILKDGEANGKPLTEDQRGMFGAACGKMTKNASRRRARKVARSLGRADLNRLAANLGASPRQITGSGKKLRRWVANAVAANADEQPRHPAKGVYQGKAKTAAERGYEQGHASHRLPDDAEAYEEDESGAPIEGEDDDIGQGDRMPKKRGKNDDRSVVNADFAHERSEHALGGTHACENECDAASKHAEAAHEKSAEGDHAGAAIAHINAAEAHKETGGKEHDRAEMLHRRAAQEHLNFTNNRRTNMGVKLSKNERKTLVDHMVGNCRTDPEDREHFESMSDATLLRVANLTRNAAKRGGDDSDEDDGSSSEEEDSSMEDNAGKPESSNADAQGDGSFAAAILAGGEEGGKGTSPVDGYVSKRGKGLEGGKKVDKGVENYLNRLPPDVRRVVVNGMKADKRYRLALAQRITANVENPKARKHLIEGLIRKDATELEALAMCVPTANRGFDDDTVDLDLGAGVFGDANSIDEIIANQDRGARGGDELESAVEAAPPTMNYGSPLTGNGGANRNGQSAK